MRPRVARSAARETAGSPAIADNLREGGIVNGRYRLEGQLGEGGFARVWNAYDYQSDLQVAIKVLTARLDGESQGSNSDTQALARFEREAKFAARLNHPNIVRIYDYGVLDGDAAYPFIVMERMHGDDLEEHVRNGDRLAPERLIGLFIDCLEGLASAHDVGIVHKDLKPENIFYTHPGRADEAFQIIDFGVATVADQVSERLTKAGEYLGTWNYMAPEYIELHQVAPAVDVYQMGLILVELFWGQSVVEEQTFIKACYRHLSGNLQIPRSLMDSELGPVLAKALARDPEDRYPDARAFANALRGIDTTTIVPIPSGKVPLVRPDSAPVDDFEGDPTQLMAAPDEALMREAVLAAEAADDDPFEAVETVIRQRPASPQHTHEMPRPSELIEQSKLANPEPGRVQTARSTRPESGGLNRRALVWIGVSVFVVAVAVAFLLFSS